MHPDVVKLLDLQSKDLALLEVNHRLDGVLAELEALDVDVQKLEQARQRALRGATDLQQQRDELENKIGNIRKMQEKRRQQLEQARHGKEIAGLMTELDMTRSVLAEEENRWMSAAEKVSGLENEAAELERQIAETQAAQEPKRAELNSRREEIERERATRLSERDRSANEVNRALRTRYERLRSARSRTVVVALAGAACGACYTQVPLNRRSQIRAGTLVDWCEACGVILYAPEEEE